MSKDTNATVVYTCLGYGQLRAAGIEGMEGDALERIIWDGAGSSDCAYAPFSLLNRQGGRRLCPACLSRSSGF